MKNKILYIAMSVIFSFCFMNYTTAEEIQDLNTVIQETSMPTDAEIMETIRKFNFDKAQEEYLFKETKRKLNALYSNKNFQSITSNETTLDASNLENGEIKTKKYTRKSKKEKLIQIPENN